MSSPAAAPLINATHSNSVLELRKRELLKQLRPFRARGSKVIRCESCLLPAVHCLCALRPQPLSKTAFCFLMYHGEAFKPSNTGRLIADLCHDNHAYLYDRTQPPQELLALLKDERYSPVIVFPSQYAEASRCIASPAEAPGVTDGRKPLFLMLDGTWREAKKMFRSPWLQSFPVLSIEPEQASAYRLREAAHLHQLCTAEVGIAILRMSGEEHAAQTMQNYFAAFRRLYIAGKPSMLQKYGKDVE